MRKILYAAAALGMIALAYNAGAAAPAKKAPAKKSAAAKSAGAKKAPPKTSGKTSGAAKTSSKKSATSRKVPATTWRNRQMAPAPERYKEIQEALAAKGYLPPEQATGAWGPSSMDALKRFQAGQNLEPSGKINSLSLIALGLGPKREAVAKPAPPPAGEQPATSK